MGGSWRRGHRLIIILVNFQEGGLDSDCGEDIEETETNSLTNEKAIDE